MKTRSGSAVAIAALVLAGCASTSTSTQTPALRVAAPTGASTVPQARLHYSVMPWHLPFAIAREALVPSAGATVIVAGGMLPGDTSSARSYELDLLTGTSTAHASLPVPVHDVAGGFYGGKPAVYGGGNSSEQSTVQQLRGGVWRVVAQMPTTRSDLSVATVGSTTYVLGGYDGAGVPTEVLAQSGGSALLPVGHLAVGVRYAASAVFGSSIYLFGGEVNGTEMDVIQRFDTATGRTRVVGHLPFAVGHASAAVLGNRVLLMGGRVGPDRGTSMAWWFDPATASMTRGKELPAPVTDAAVATSADHRTAWLLGGESPTVRDQVIRISLS